MKPINWFGTSLIRPTVTYHQIAPTLYQDIKPLIIEARPSALKIVADGQEFGMFTEYYNALKDYTVFLARPYTPCEVLAQSFNSGISPENAALAYHNAIQPLLGYIPGAYWGSWNEPPIGCEDWLDRCDAERIRLAKLHGYRVSCLEWSEGTPHVLPWDADNSYAKLQRTLTAINAVGPGTAILAPHEYCRQHDGGFLTQPWRIGRINDALGWMEANGYTNVYVVISEYGRDAPKWKEIGMPGIVYGNELIDEAVHDMYHPKVIGRTTFTLDFSPSWQKCDIYGQCFVTVNSYLTSHRPAYVPPIPSEPLQPEQPEPPTLPIGQMVTTANLFLRSGPGMTRKKLTIMPKGTLVDVDSITTDGWAHVTVTVKGWMLTNETEASQYTDWEKINSTLTGWCAYSYLV